MKKFLFIGILMCQFHFGCTQSKKEEKPYDCKIEEPEKGDCTEGQIRNSTTTFPMTSRGDDYHVTGYQIKVAFPLEADFSRIWVKGNENLTFAQVFTVSESALSEPVELQPPFFTSIISVTANETEVLVKFGKDTAALPDSNKKLTAFPKNKSFFEKKDDTFSIVYYGCFEPFKVNPETNLGEVLHEKDTLNYVIRKMFEEVVNEREFEYTPYQSEKTQKAKLLTNPKMLIGGGDQVYTDAGYEEKNFENHPLSAWAHKCSNPYPLLDTLEFAKHLDRCYLHFNSFDCFASIDAKYPSLDVWDDHEIRDGWGSHGDEYNDDGTLAESLKPYYMLSRKAYLDHQYSIGPNMITENTLWDNPSLEQQVQVNGIKIFAFDLRSNRNSCQQIALEESQLNKFKNWCRNLESGEEAVIVSSIPFFYESSAVIVALAEDVYEGELRDDIIDSWASRANKEQRDTILSELIKLRMRNVQPIILSGDVHIGGLITAWYRNPKTDEFEKLCYEMISSGLSHESMGEARSGVTYSMRQRSSKVKEGDATIKINGSEIFPVFEFTKGRLNFGALEFSKNKKTKASIFIVNGDEEQIAERELTLDWQESFDAYWDRAKRPFHWYLMPWKWGAKKLPEVPYNLVTIPELTGK